MKKYNLIKIADTLFPFFTITSVFLICVEMFTYEGFLHRFLMPNATQLAGMTLLAITYFILLSIYSNYSISIYTLFFIRGLAWCALPATLLLLLLQSLEASNYSNYIFSTFHLHLALFTYIQSILLAMLFSQVLLWLRTCNLSFYFNPSHIPILQKDPYLTIGSTFLFFIFLLYGIETINFSGQLIINNLIQIATAPNATYDEKMKTTWGFIYGYSLFVKEKTPPTSTIAIPPAQSHWLTEGNSVLMKYFLYPRNIVNMTESNNTDTLYQLPDGDYRYVMMAKGLWHDKQVDYGWPKVSLSTSLIHYYFEDMPWKTVRSQSFDPNSQINQTSWGIIELR